MSHRRSPRIPTLLAALLAGVLLVSGCGGGGDSEKKAEKSPQQVMEQAKKKFDDASSVHVDLSTKSLPDDGNAVLGARGDLTHDPAFKGTVDVLFKSVTLKDTPVTAVDGKVYAKLPFQLKTTAINPADYGAPDPADFADPDTGLSSLLTQLDGLKKQGQLRSGDVILTTYTGTLPGKAVKEIIPSAAADETYETRVGVDTKGYARTVKITGTFFAGGGDVTYNVKFSDYDAGVKISAPSA